LLLLREDGLLTNSSALYNGYGLGDDWFEGALLRPDLVLSDVARAINSSNVPQASTSSSRSCLLLYTDMTKEESQNQSLWSALKIWFWIHVVCNERCAARVPSASGRIPCNESDLHD